MTSIQCFGQDNGAIPPLLYTSCDMALTKLGTGRCLVLCLHKCKILILHTPQETLEGREYGRRDPSR
jgi:hypothetical protein